MKYIYSNIIKRLLDIVLSIFFLELLMPLFLVISLAIIIDSPGPILFRQIRTGLNGRDFELFKFRSMHKDNDIFDFNTQDRITRVGKFIRKTSLDEIPQLINIFKGDMSFIGPRPWVSVCYKYFTPGQKKRNNVRPGITGLAQVSGRKDLNIIKRIELDLEYVEKISFLFDMKIILKTIIVVFNSSDNTRKNYTFSDEMADLKENYLNSVT